MDALPELERRATEVLNFLIPSGAKPFDVVSAAKQLGDPKNTQSRRLQRFKSRLESEMEVFGGQTYVDVDSVKNMLVPKLPAAVTTGASPWTPEPIIHRANCAVFALQVLLAHNTDTRRRVIQVLRERFPAPVMVRSDTGTSRLGDTFELALGMRTQWLLMEMEARQNEDTFDPEAVLTDVFYDVDKPGERVLSGFSFDSFEDENRHLPERYYDAVQRQIDKMRMAMEDDDGLFSIQSLKSAFGWRTFQLEAASWIRKRNDEIAQELANLRDTNDVVDACHLEWDSRGSLAGTARSSPRASTGRVSNRGSVLPSASPARSAISAPLRQQAPTSTPSTSAAPPLSRPSASAGRSAEPAGILNVNKRSKPRK